MKLFQFLNKTIVLNVDQIIELAKFKVPICAAFFQIKSKVSQLKVLMLVKIIKKPIYLVAVLGVDLTQIFLNLEGPHLLFLSFDFFLL